MRAEGHRQKHSWACLESYAITYGRYRPDRKKEAALGGEAAF